LRSLASEASTIGTRGPRDPAKRVFRHHKSAQPERPLRASVERRELLGFVREVIALALEQAAAFEPAAKALVGVERDLFQVFGRGLYQAMKVGSTREIGSRKDAIWQDRVQVWMEIEGGSSSVLHDHSSRANLAQAGLASPLPLPAKDLMDEQVGQGAECVGTAGE
jgi:hypothetical protein